MIFENDPVEKLARRESLRVLLRTIASHSCKTDIQNLRMTFVISKITKQLVYQSALAIF